MVGGGVDYGDSSAKPFDSVLEADKLVKAGGRMMACGTCLKLRQKQGSNVCLLSNMDDLYRLVAESDKIVSF